MAKQPSNKKTVINGEISQSKQTIVNAIGFDIQGKSRVVVRPDASSFVEHDEPAHRRGQRTDADNIILTVVRGYMEERLKKCYQHGLDQDLMKKLDKIFIKHYDTIA